MGAMTLLITGAGGYIGRHTVAEARQRGHHVLAVLRHAPETTPWAGDDGVETQICDLATGAQPLVAALTRADAVLHCAASMSGDETAHQRDTLSATQNLLAVMPKNTKLIHLSSMAVYSYRELEADDLVTESATLETRPLQRDAYARAKLSQEQMVSDASAKCEHKLTILRAGAVFGSGRLWNAHLGPVMGPLLVLLARQGDLPLCHISTCARALIGAAERPAAGAVNVLDEDLPHPRRYLTALRHPPRFTLPLSWRLLLPLAQMLSAIGMDRKLPGLLRPAVLRARFLPLHYDNSKLREALGVRQDHGFEALMHEAQS